MAKNHAVTGFALPKDVIKWIHTESDRAGQTRSEFVRRVLQREIDRTSQKR